jgi:N-acetylglutamate synthase-like GNAT family acetyltransferase
VTAEGTDFRYVVPCGSIEPVVLQQHMLIQSVVVSPNYTSSQTRRLYSSRTIR